MHSKDLIKIVVLLLLYGFVTPALGAAMKGRRNWQRLAFCAMCFMTISGFFAPAEWGFSIAYEENYRGHARGYQFFFNEALAGALILAAFLESPRRFRWLPPGLLLYLIYVGLSLVSIVNAPHPAYTWMAFLRAIEVTVLFVAAYQFLKTIQDVRLFLTTFAFIALWELLAVLKLKYVDHHYQVTGTFEHQNALSMFATMIGMVFLSVGVGPKQPRSKLYLVGFIACAWIVECTLSRGGLVAFSLGAAGVMGLSLAEKITSRRLVVGGALVAVTAAGLMLSLNTIIERFNAPYNQDSEETRRMLNTASREMLQDHPLGIGWNNYGVVINPPYRYGDIVDDYFRMHGELANDTNKGIVESLYYLILSETGYEGLASYLLLIAFFLWCNLRAALFFRHHFLGAVSLGIAMGCIANYLQSFLERVLTQPRNLMLWLLLLAITARIHTWRKIAKEKRRQSSLLPQPSQVRLKTGFI